MKKINSPLSNLFVILALVTVFAFLIGLLVIENGVFKNEIINTGYEILDYDVIYRKDDSSPTGILEEYIIDVGDINSEEVTIAFYTKHQYCKVYIDNELVSSLEPSREYQFTKTVGSNWIMFNVSKDDVDKRIIVHITPAYDNVIETKIDFIKGTAFSIFFKIFRANLPQIIVGFIAIVIGVVFCIIGFIRRITKKESYLIFMLGLFSLFLGIWRAFDSQFVPLIFPKKTIFIYYSIVTMLTICPIPFFNILKIEMDHLWRRIYNLICIVISFVAIVQIALQVVYEVDVRKYLFIYHNGLLLCLLIVAVCEIYHVAIRFERTSHFNKYLPAISVFAVLVDLTIYFYTKDTANLFCTICTFIFYNIVSGINIMRKYTLQEKMLKDELKQSQITILLSQIQPHFIYNTLSSIRYLCKTDADLAQQSIDDFSLYLRCNMDSLSKSDVIPFEKELLFIETYVKLEKLRFGDKINVVYDIQESKFSIPSLTLQPLIENAIKHGVSVKEEGGTVTLKTQRTYRDLIITITDDGVGFDVDKTKEDEKSHIGLTNVKNRFAYLMDTEFNVTSNENGTEVKIIIRNFRKGIKNGNNSTR